MYLAAFDPEVHGQQVHLLEAVTHAIQSSKTAWGTHPRLTFTSFTTILCRNSHAPPPNHTNDRRLLTPLQGQHTLIFYRGHLVMTFEAAGHHELTLWKRIQSIKTFIREGIWTDVKTLKRNVWFSGFSLYLQFRYNVKKTNVSKWEGPLLCWLVI